MHFVKTLPALLCAFDAGAAWAQVVPDAGQTMRQLQRPGPATQSPARAAPTLAVPDERPAMAAPDTARIPVKSFRITGAQRYSAPELAALVHDWTGRELSMTELQAAAARITRHYREHGFLVARAYVPAQSLREGIVEIAVLEGQMGKVEFKNASRVSDARARALLGDARPGGAILGPTLERGLIALNETPGIGRASAALQPGASVGLSDLVVALEPGAAVSGSADMDNHGNRYTGRYRLGGTLYANSPLRLGDQFSARIVGSDSDLYYARIAYRVPVGSSGLALGAGYSASRYRLGVDFAVLDVNGHARIATAFATYPLVRSAALNLTGALSADDKTLQDRVDTVQSVSDKTVRSVTAGVLGNGTRGNIGYGFSASYTTGKLDIASPAIRVADAASARTHGSYGKFSYAATGTMAFAGPWSGHGGLNGQLASQNLDSSEKFVLGGADGVRAYAPGEAAGDEGYLATAEVRYAVPASALGAMQLAGFVDHGCMRINKAPFAVGENRRRLSAAGIGLTWTAPRQVLVRASLAWKVGNARSTADTDRSVRAWMQAVKYF